MMDHSDAFERLMRLQGLMRRQHFMNRPQNRPYVDRSRGQGRVLAALHIKPEIPTRDLAFILGIRQQSLNELLTKLEKSGYVERHPSEQDRRVMIVHLTDAGREVEVGCPNSAAFLDVLSEEDERSLIGFLDLLIAELEREIGEDDGEDEARFREWVGAEEDADRLMRMRGGHHGRGHCRGGEGPCDERGHGRGRGGDGPCHDTDHGRGRGGGRGNGRGRGRGDGGGRGRGRP